METSRRLRTRRSSLAGGTPSLLAQRMEQAIDFGYSQPFTVADLATRNSDLDSAYAAFYADNPDFAKEFGIASGLDDLKEASIFIPDALEEVFAASARLAGAKIIAVYNRVYEPGDEGTGWHDDIDTGSDLVVTRTLYGRARFGCEALDRAQPSLSEILGADSLVAFMSECQHFAGSPLDGGPREIEGYAIKLAS